MTYLNAVTNLILSCTVYADDTTLSSTIYYVSDINSNTNAINAEICKVIEWLKINKLSLNKTKSKYMTFHMPKKKYHILH